MGVTNNLAPADTKSDFSGFFRLTLRRGIKRGRPIVLQFRHPDFQPVDLPVIVGDKLYVVRMTPLHPDAGRFQIAEALKYPFDSRIKQ